MPHGPDDAEDRHQNVYDDWVNLSRSVPPAHRRVHNGKDGSAYNTELVTRLTTIEP